MIPLIGGIASFFVRRGVQSKYAGPLAYLSAAVSLLAALGLLWGLWSMIVHRHDAKVIGHYEAGVQNEVRAEVNTATVRADAAQNVQAAVDAERQAEVVAGINAAVAAHPVEARHATGPASQAALDRLRKR